MLLCGVLDTAANVLFLLATRTGSLSVSGVLVSLYPVVVVLLARFVLRERLTGLQLTGVGLALTASALLASAADRLRARGRIGHGQGRHDGSHSCASHASGVIGTPTRIGHR